MPDRCALRTCWDIGDGVRRVGGNVIEVVALTTLILSIEGLVLDWESREYDLEHKFGSLYSMSYVSQALAISKARTLMSLSSIPADSETSMSQLTDENNRPNKTF
jgi:hypothetical protein